MADAWQSIKLKVFEHVVTGPSQSLLRVSGKAPRRRTPGDRPTLVIATQSGEERFEAIAAPPDDGGTLRAAYAVPTSLVQAGGAAWLEHPGGKRTRLPEPTQGVARRRDATSPAAGDDDAAAAALEQAHADISALQQRLAAIDHPAAADPAAAPSEALERRVRELEGLLESRDAQIADLQRQLASATPTRESLERERDQLRTRQQSLERELDQSRDQLRIMTFERDELERQASAFDAVAVKARERAAAAEAANEKVNAALRELEIWRGELERRLADTTSELGLARTAREADERELGRLRAALMEFERGDGAAHRQANGGEAGPDAETVAAQAAEIERLAAELAALRARSARQE